MIRFLIRMAPDFEAEATKLLENILLFLKRWQRKIWL